MAASTLNADVIIVGSGAGGGMTAYALTRAGIRCLVLEAGRNYDPATEINMLGQEHEAPLRGQGTTDKPFGFYDATIDGGWRVPGEPYSVAKDTKFEWWRARMLGGRTNHWARHVPRFGPYDFKPFSRDGLGVDWPISYDDVAPWYDKTEEVVGIWGAPNGLENHPDSPPGIAHTPPKPRAYELLIKAAAGELGIPVVPSRYAILTKDKPDKVAPRSACYYASPCGRGCNIGAAFQTTTSLLPMAMATGRLKIVTNAMVSKVLMKGKDRAEGVEYIDKTTGQTHQVRAKAVVLAASACETSRLLLNSRNADYPNGLANSSGQVGRNLVDTVGGGVSGFIPGLEGRPVYNEEGADQAHMYIPWWLYKEQAEGKLDFARGYHYEIGGGFRVPGPWTGGADLPNVNGADLRAALRRKMGSRVSLTVRGEMIPNKDCYAEIDPSLKDKWGIPVLKYHWKWSSQEINMVRHGMVTARAIIRRMGGTVYKPEETAEENIKDGGVIIHEGGTARMGADPKTSVLDQWQQCWDVPNLLVTDGAMLASNPHKNPTLTIMALAWRASENLAAKLKGGAFA
ncbi:MULTISPECIES: GMC family oxidoreductase [Asticcacaulis]|uniref:GMC family oxidoreductase n=1 Tax=Asticcacaulis TaxID=76890 RepID=UPI001AEBA325|nr:MULTISPECIES: GMC family oxidoreductase [Asticcacaulis]MBP2157956.1 choline dehydrogenase-like flavoprotein [Asticcacaulis solisilvae]MDR6799001.1 choline dehydrogenase-like flavoprotein [Asticcacaulis sp. BE141]